MGIQSWGDANIESTETARNIVCIFNLKFIDYIMYSNIVYEKIEHVYLQSVACYT